MNELQSISHSKDINFKDERELRRAQQNSFMSEHRNVASKLPEEAVNKLTSFPNVQSGKSFYIFDFFLNPAIWSQLEIKNFGISIVF